jgi:hypothetical protein
MPVWLYECGLPLQAIATYGWLAARYGHYSKIAPSYGTLAKELGVSRGSVINHVAALVDVGAVRIVESGADVQTSNTYEIAFERPFPREAQVEGGQYSDHPKTGVMDALANLQVRGGQNADPYLKVGAELVSGLTRTGQNTDQGGQPVVHERNEVLDKTQTSSSCLPQDAAGASDPASEEQEEADGCALEPNPDALAIIDAVDLGGRSLLGGLRGEVARILTDKLAEGWTRKALMSKFQGCTVNAPNPPGVFAARVRALGAAPVVTKRSTGPLVWDSVLETDLLPADDPVDVAMRFLIALPEPWRPGRKAAAYAAGELVDNVAAQGWRLDHELVAYLTDGQPPGDGVGAVLRHRIAELPPYRTEMAA